MLGPRLTILAAGAFVAGLRAGFIYNTFPLMDGRSVPADYWQLAPWYLNWFENSAAVQFDHRLLAETTWLAIARAVALRPGAPTAAAGAPSRSLRCFAVATLQFALGIATCSWSCRCRSPWRTRPARSCS